MAYDGLGTFNRLYNWVTDKANSVKIRADRMDAEMDGIATALSTCITKDGQTTPTANLPMGNFKHTGVADGTALTHYATVKQLQNDTPNWCGTATGTADAIAISPSPAMTAYAAGQRFSFISSGANTGAATLAVSAQAAKAIKKKGAVALDAGDIVSGQVVTVRYDGTNFQMESLGSAVTTAGTQTLTNKTINGATINTPTVLSAIDANFTIQDNSDSTKVARFECSGITTGTTRIYTFPNADTTLVGEGTFPPIRKVLVQAFVSSGTYTPTAGLAYCIIEAIGGGGGGAGASTTGAAPRAAAGGGGGGGGYIRLLLTAADIGASQTVTIGAAGTAGLAAAGNGGAGGNTTVGALLTAGGGSGGVGDAGNSVASVGGQGGAGGSVAGGNVNIVGSHGGPGYHWGNISLAQGGFGGASGYAGGVGGVRENNVGNGATNFGGGGGGGAAGGATTSRAGGPGVAGLVIITEYIK